MLDVQGRVAQCGKCIGVSFLLVLGPYYAALYALRRNKVWNTCYIRGNGERKNGLPLKTASGADESETKGPREDTGRAKQRFRIASRSAAVGLGYTNKRLRF